MDSYMVLLAGAGQFLGALLRPIWQTVAPTIGVLIVMRLFGMTLASQDLLLLLVAAALVRNAKD
jgi:hypothetical protein